MLSIKHATSRITVLFLLLHGSFCGDYDGLNFNDQAEGSPKIGILLEPYKFTDNDSISDVKDMLRLIADRGFREISTLAINQTTNLIRREIIPAVIKFNLEFLDNNSSRALSLIPVFSIHSTTCDKDIENIISVVTQANNKSPETKTIKNLVIYTKPDKAVYHLKTFRDRLNTLQITDFPNLGISSSRCLESLEEAKIEKNLDLLQYIKFIICRKLPSPKALNPVKEATEIVKYFRDTQILLDNITNYTVQVIGMTGWNNSKYDANAGVVEARGSLRTFWDEVEKRSAEHNISIHVFHAFETADANKHPKIKNPFYKIEPHFGWWLPATGTGGTVVFKERVNYEEAIPSFPLREVILGTVGGCLIVVFSIVITVLYYKLKIANSLLSEKDIAEFKHGIYEVRTNDSNDHTEDALRVPYDLQYEIPKSKFQIEKATLLGKGEFGVVYRGKLEGHEKDVAFKVTAADIKTMNLKSMLSEIKIMIHVGKHPNVVSIIGACTRDMREGHVYIALELCDLGSLESFLRKFREEFLQNDVADFSEPSPSNTCKYNSASTRRYTAGPSFFQNQSITTPQSMIPMLHKWAYDIANGMEHIALKRIIHSDLAARNVLISINQTAKITDFGLSRRLYEYTNYTKQNQGPLPWRWMAIESLEEMNFSTKSDVWSFGVTLYEVFTLGLLPYPGLTWTVSFTDDVKSGSITLPQPEYASDDIYDLMTTCWEINPHMRPSFSALKDILAKLVDDVEPNIYVQTP